MCTFWRAFWTMYSMKAVQLKLRFTTVEKETTIVSLCCFCISQVRAIQFPQNLFKTEHRHVHCRTACSLLKLDDVSLSYARKGGRIWEKKWVLFHVFWSRKQGWRRIWWPKNIPRHSPHQDASGNRSFEQEKAGVRTWQWMASVWERLDDEKELWIGACSVGQRGHGAKCVCQKWLYMW